MGMLDRVKQTRAALVAPAQRRGQPVAEQRLGLSQLMEMFSYGGVGYSVYGYDHSNRERDTTSFIQYVQSYYKDNGVIFSVVLARMLLFTEARFQWQRLNNGRPGDLYGGGDLGILETPWPNGTTGELLARMEQDVSLHGNFYAVRENNRIRRLRPDWVEIVLDAPPSEAVASNIRGYLYRPGGTDSQVASKIYEPHEMCHWSPIPDPLAQYRGMSWVTPVVREIEGDRSASDHKLKFFENAATPNLAVSFSENISKEQFNAFMAAMNASHQGSGNAYKTMYLGGGADVKVIGANMEQMDFKSTQGAGETRICAAGGVPPIIVGLSEGLQSATYSNYGMARRKFGDHWARPQWRMACAALATLVRAPNGARLWYDDRDIAFLREDQKDVASIQTQQASTMKQLIDAGYTPESVQSAIVNEDWTLLEHTGLFSVQLQPPGAMTKPGGGGPPSGGANPPDSGDGGGPPDKPTPPAEPGPSGGATDEPQATESKSLEDLRTEIGELRSLVRDLLGEPDPKADERSAWEEAKHPRGPDGKFGEAGGALPSVDAIDLSDGQKAALRDYTGGRFRDINETLRFDVRPYSDTNDLIERMDAAFEAVPELRDPIVVNRRVRSPERMFGEPGSRVGQVFQDNGYVSTTGGEADPFFGEGGISIRVPAGGKALDVSSASQNPGEKEVLLPRGAKFRVVKDQIGPNGQRQTELEVVK